MQPPPPPPPPPPPGRPPLHTLPQLPVPPLHQTLRRFLRSASPHLSPEERKRAAREADNLLASGDGPRLQAHLEARAASRPVRGWLSDWWLEHAYLAFRDPLPVNVNFAIRLDGKRQKQRDEDGKEVPLCRAAARTLSDCLAFYELVTSGQLPVERARGEPQCMAQYTRLFGQGRVADAPLDRLVVAAAATSAGARHIIALRRGQIFLVEVRAAAAEVACTSATTHAVGLLHTPAVIEAQLERVCARADAMTDSELQLPIGLLTAGPRDNWAAARDILSAVPANFDALRSIDEALCVVCLDGDEVTAGGGGQQQLSAILHGNGTQAASGNRWFDKLQFIFGPSGLTGINAEHSPLEAPPLARMLDWAAKVREACGRSSSSDGCGCSGDCGDDSINAGASVSCTLPDPKLLRFEYLPSVATHISEAGTAIDALVACTQVHEHTIVGIGRDAFKAARKSPDACFQVALQLAYYRLHGSVGACYETASTRTFAHGRTETIRSSTPEVAAFCEIMTATKASVTERTAALHAAIDAHVSQTRDCMNGQGVDRHLLGLKLAALELGVPVPAVLEGTAAKRSAHFVLSTSAVRLDNISATPVFGPAVPGGYGVCYNIRPGETSCGVTAAAPPTPATTHDSGGGGGSGGAGIDSALSLSEALEESLRDVHSLLAGRARL